MDSEQAVNEQRDRRRLERDSEGHQAASVRRCCADFRSSLDRRPFGTRPSGDGPLKRIVGALTGQKDKDTATKGAGGESAA